LSWLAVALSKRGWLRPTTVLWTGLFSVSVVGGAMASVKQFCCGNLWIPELLLAWPVAFMLAGDWLSGSRSPDAGPMPAAAAGVLALSSALLVALGYDASPFLPDTVRWHAAEQLDRLARGPDGGRPGGRPCPAAHYV
jgi:hypothetical protein